jgi:hypothetical protein
VSRAVGAVLTVIIVPVVTFSVLLVAWVGVKLLDPLATTMAPPASLDWFGPMLPYQFFALGIVGLVLVVFVWAWVRPILGDVRQDVRGPRP